MVGNVALGSEHPIRIQTMTTTDTKDVAGTVEQVSTYPICLSFILFQIMVWVSLPALSGHKDWQLISGAFSDA